MTPGSLRPGTRRSGRRMEPMGSVRVSATLPLVSTMISVAPQPTSMMMQFFFWIWSLSSRAFSTASRSRRFSSVPSTTSTSMPARRKALSTKLSRLAASRTAEVAMACSLLTP